MGEHGFRTETEAWDEDTKMLEEIEKEIKEIGVNENNEFSLMNKLLDVSNRTSLCGNVPEYLERVRYCNRLEKIIGTK